MEWTFSLDKIDVVARELWGQIAGTTVVALHGAMGAGKTTLVNACCQVKNVRQQVGSPTFSIINEYTYEDGGAEKTIFHLDLYRLKGIEEAVQAGIEDCLYGGQLCFVEWPEKALALLPDNTVHVYIDLVNEDIRRLAIKNK